MMSPSIESLNIANYLSYRQMQIELKKRQLNATGKKVDIVKRLQVAYEKEKQKQILNAMTSTFEDLANEIYREIFDYLNPLHIVQSFDGLNHRLNSVIRSIPMRINLNQLNKREHKQTLKCILPKIINQTIALELGQTSNVTLSPLYDAEFLIDLFIQSFQLTHFPHLRFLSLNSPSSKQLDFVLMVLPQLSSLRSLRILEQHYYGSDNETVCKLTLATRRYSPIRYDLSRLTHISIATSPPFRNLAQLIEHLSNKISLDYFHLHICSAFFSYPQSLLCLDYDNLSRFVPDMTYLKIDIAFGTYQPMFDLIRHFPHVQHLSIKTLPQAYADGYQWAEFLAEMRHLIALDLDLSLDSYTSENQLQTFQTKFWFEHQWIVQSSGCKIQHRSCCFVEKIKNVV